MVFWLLVDFAELVLKSKKEGVALLGNKTVEWQKLLQYGMGTKQTSGPMEYSRKPQHRPIHSNKTVDL